jgi:hypothetical protein
MGQGLAELSGGVHDDAAMLAVTTPVDQDQHVRGTAESCPEMVRSLREVTAR